MKAYVRGYDTIVDKGQNPKKQPEPPEFAVEYRAKPEWVIEARHEADAECQILRRHSVSVGMHFCDFSVEELPSGGFAVICADHPGPSGGI